MTGRQRARESILVRGEASVCMSPHRWSGQVREGEPRSRVRPGWRGRAVSWLMKLDALSARIRRGVSYWLVLESLGLMEGNSLGCRACQNPHQPVLCSERHAQLLGAVQALVALPWGFWGS